MTMHDERTLLFYAHEAERYAARYDGSHSKDLDRFLAKLPIHARILELGCGAGRDTAAMMRRGFHPVPTDGSPEMAAEASRRLGYPVQTLLFDNLEDVDQYDGVWASACLLHLPLKGLPNVLGRIHRALRAGGWFYASYKAGNGEGRDSLGRYYNYLTEEVLTCAYTCAADWSEFKLETKIGSGYDNQPADWLAVFART